MLSIFTENDTNTSMRCKEYWIVNRSTIFAIYLEQLRTLLLIHLDSLHFSPTCGLSNISCLYWLNSSTSNQIIVIIFYVTMTNFCALYLHHLSTRETIYFCEQISCLYEFLLWCVLNACEYFHMNIEANWYVPSCKKMRMCNMHKLCTIYIYINALNCWPFVKGNCEWRIPFTKSQWGRKRFHCMAALFGLHKLPQTSPVSTNHESLSTLRMSEWMTCWQRANTAFLWERRYRLHIGITCRVYWNAFETNASTYALWKPNYFKYCFQTTASNESQLNSRCVEIVLIKEIRFCIRFGATKPHSVHDDVIKWKHFPRYWPFVRWIHRSPVNSPHKGQWRGALMFSLICAWIYGWVNNREAGDLRRHRAHYDVIVLF